MSTNYNRIKVADLETNEPNKTLATNQNGELEFIQISDNTSDPVSATNAGIVDNTSLQELGGVDKTINTVRIGMGGGNVNTNTTIGRNALVSNSTGQFNTAIGRNALYYNISSQGNTGIGYCTLTFNTGERNTAIGSSALYANTTGSFNTVVGNGSGKAQTTANNNILVGFQAGRAITTGSNNLLIENTINDGVTTGSKNIILNPLSTGVTGIRTGNNNTLIGGLNVADVSDSIIIATGAGLVGFNSNSSGLTTIPRQTNVLITADTTGKAIITKEYLATSLPSLITANVAPTSATSPGTKGDIRIDNDYVYICVATNTWKRSALTTW